MDNFVLKVQAQLDTSQLSSALNGFKGKLKVDVDPSNITKKIQDAINAASKQKVKLPDVSGGSGGKAKTSGNTNEYIKQLQKIEAMTNKINTKSFDASLAKLNAQQSKYFDNDSAQYKAASTAVKQYETALKEARSAQEKFKTSGSKSDGEALAKSYDKVTNSLKLAQSEMQILATSQEKVVDSFSKASAMNSFNQYLTKNSKAVKAYSTEIDDLKTKLKSVETTGQLKSVQGEIKALQTRAAMEGNIGRSVFDEFKNNISKFSSWLGIGNLVAGGIRGFKDAITELKEMDSILTEISKVSDMTASQIQQLGKDSFDYANKYGKTVTSYLQGVTEMNRSGYYGNQGIELANTSILAQAAGDMNADVANKYLLATNAAYEYAGSAEKLNDVLDGQNMITNRNSVDMTDMAEATTQAGSMAAQAGVQINQLSALVGTAVSRTKKDGNEVGTALKALFINLQNTQNDKITGTFKDLGLSMTKMVGDSEYLKTPIELIKELSQVYNALPEGSVQKANILTNIGGKHHANVLSSILSGYSDYEKMLQDYSEGSGSAAVEAEKSANNWEGSLNKLSNSWTKFISNFAQSDQITGGIKLVDGFVSAMDGLVKTITPLGAIGAGAGIFAFFKNLDEPINHRVSTKIPIFYIVGLADIRD